MSASLHLVFLLVLVAMELTYFRIARAFGILDHPNIRSLHDQPTIRGGGIIFYLSAALFYTITLRPGPYFMVGLTLVSLVGFIDDVRSLSTVVRLSAQCLAFALVLCELDVSGLNFWMIILIFIVSVGALNTFNFMDGINGITGGYGLVALGSLLFVDIYTIHFIEIDFLYSVILALVIFCYFNFRKKAICFAGDVGSMSIGFIILYLLVKLIIVSDNYVFIFFLSVYGVDSVLTIIQRLWRKENIFKPHKLHLFQVLVNQYNIPHVQMSLAYALLQLVINIILLLSLSLSLGYQYLVGTGTILLLCSVYWIVKLKYLIVDKVI